MSTGAARTRPELASTVSAAAQLQSTGARRDGRSVPNVNFYIPTEEDGRTGVSEANVDRHSTIDRARVNLNLSLKNVCSPAPRNSADGDAAGSGRDDGSSVVTSISTNSSGAMAKDLLDAAHDADVDAEERDKRSGAGLSGTLRSWANKFRRWRSCVSRNASGVGDRKQSMSASMAVGGSGRGREASVASVMAAEKSQQSTSSRILRAFSHVGEPERG